MKVQLIDEISASLSTMQGAGALAEKKIWDLVHAEDFEAPDREALGHMISHLQASGRQLTSYLMFVEGLGA